MLDVLLLFHKPLKTLLFSLDDSEVRIGLVCFMIGVPLKIHPGK